MAAGIFIFGSASVIHLGKDSVVVDEERFYSDP